MVKNLHGHDGWVSVATEFSGRVHKIGIY